MSFSLVAGLFLSFFAALSEGVKAPLQRSSTQACPPDIEDELYSEYSPGELAFTSYTERVNQIHLTCLAIGENQTFVQKVEIEFMKGYVGLGAFAPIEDFAYPCPDQNSWGQLNIEVMDLNGEQIYETGGQSITINEQPVCSEGERAIYDGSVHITQVASDSLTINAHAFRNSSDQAQANLNNTMVLGDMGACKIELIYAFKPKTGGGLNATIAVRVHAFGLSEDWESWVNAHILAKTNTTTNMLSLYIPENVQLAGAGKGPDGCGSTFNTTGEDKHLVDVSLSFICAQDNTQITGGSFSWSHNQLTIDLSPTQAPESCELLYWDPLMSPLQVQGGAYQFGHGDDNSGVAVAIGIGVAVTVAVVVIIIVGVVVAVACAMK